MPLLEPLSRLLNQNSFHRRFLNTCSMPGTMLGSDNEMLLRKLGFLPSRSLHPGQALSPSKPSTLVCHRPTSLSELQVQCPAHSQWGEWIDARRVQTKWYSGLGRGGGIWFRGHLEWRRGPAGQKPSPRQLGLCLGPEMVCLGAAGDPEGWRQNREGLQMWSTPKARLWDFPWRECGTSHICEQERWSDQCLGKTTVTAV